MGFTGHVGCRVKICIRKRAKIDLQSYIDTYYPSKQAIKDKKRHLSEFASDTIKRLKNTVENIPDGTVF